TALLVFLGVLAAGVSHIRSSTEPEQPAEEPIAAPAEKPAAVPKKAEPEVAEAFTYAGRVLDPDGKPKAGAKVLLCGLTPGVIEFRVRAASGPDGTFRFTVRRDEFGDKEVVPPSRSRPERYVHVGAPADGCGAACVGAGKLEQRENLTLWLPAEELVKGRVLDLEGKAVAGVAVSAHIRSMRTAKDHRPLPFDAPDDSGSYSGNLLPHDADRTRATSDKDGWFTLRGLGRGWLSALYISGPTVVNARAQLVARPDKPTEVGGTGIWTQEKGAPKLVQYGSTFTFIALPCKPITGVVREKGTGKPIAE